jgi:hypothetical protein
MAGALTISTLNNDTGVLATQNGMTGIAKAWVNFQGGQGTTAGVINNSFNVSSVTVNSAGNFTINFTTAMPNANYVMCGSSNYDASAGGTGRYLGLWTVPTTTSCRITVSYQYNAEQSTGMVTAMFVGN